MTKMIFLPIITVLDVLKISNKTGFDPLLLSVPYQIWTIQ